MTLTKTTLISGAVMAGVMALGATSVQAKEPQPKIQPPAPQAQQAGQPGLREQFQQVQQQLKQIQQKTVEGNPELKKQGEALQTLIDKKMEKQGSSPEEDMARLESIREEATAGEVSEEKKKELAKEFRAIQQGLMKARQKVMQSEEVKKQQEAYRSDLISAMQEQNPKTEQLLAEIQQLQQQRMQRMMQMQQQMQQQQGGKGPKGPAPAPKPAE